MYKRFSIQQLTTIQTSVFDHLGEIMRKEQIPLFKKFLRNCHSIWHTTTYFKSGNPLFRIIKKTHGCTLIDEVEKVEIHCSEDDVSTLHSMMKNSKKLKAMNKKNKSIMDTLREDFQWWKHHRINGKPYLVYDIETTYATNDLSQCKWIIWYVIDTSKENPKFQYVWPDDYTKFFNYLLQYDGYIIWWNQIWFDNPVTAYNAGGTQEQIDILNEKSIDPFLFLQHLTGKRIWLNRASQALVWVKKTLESWAEAEVLYNRYLNEWDESAMKELKKYCRNDVKMTLLTFLYLMEYLSIYREGEQNDFTLEDLVTKSQKKNKKTPDSEIVPTDWGVLL